MGQREVDLSLTSFTSAPLRAAVPRTKTTGSREKGGLYSVLLDFFRNNYGNCFFVGQLFLAVGLSFFCHHFLGDSQLNGACDSMIPSMIIEVLEPLSETQ